METVPKQFPLRGNNHKRELVIPCQFAPIRAIPVKARLRSLPPGLSGQIRPNPAFKNIFFPLACRGFRWFYVVCALSARSYLNLYSALRVQLKITKRTHFGILIFACKQREFRALPLKLE